MLGDESTIDETFSDKEQLILKAYLNGGGKLFVTGSEVAWDLGSKGTATDKEFLTQYLKADYVADNPTPNTPVAVGVTGSIFDGLSISFGQNYPEDYPDVITPINGGIPVMNYNATQVAAVSYEGMFPAGTKGGKMVYMAYPFETIGVDIIRNKILLKLHTFLSSPVDVKEESIIPGKYSIKVVPNPFNPTTNVMLNVTEAGKYKIEVYNVLGQKVNDLFNGELNTGNHSFNLNMLNEPSGVYIIEQNQEAYF